MRDIPVSKSSQDNRVTVGVYLPNRPYPEPWRLHRVYARQLRDMNLLSFINRAKDVRLHFTPDPRAAFPPAPPVPGDSLGLNHRQLENGVTLHPLKRTKTRCIRATIPTLTQCRDNNHVPA